MFTQQQKNYLLGVLSAVVPSGKTAEDVRKSLALYDQVVEEVKALPVEVPVDAQGALPAELIKTVEQATNGKHRRKSSA